MRRFLSVLVLVVTIMVGINIGYGQQITLTVMTKAGVVGPTSALIKEIAKNFEQKMASEGVSVEVKVNYFNVTDSNYKMKLVTEFSAGMGPDIVAIDGKAWLPEFVQAGYLYPLNEFVQKWDGWNQFYPAFQKIVTINGKIYGLMWDTDARVIYYRKDIFKKAGLPVPWQPDSWYDILAACKMLKKKLKGVIPFGTFASETNIGGSADWFLMALYGAGGNLYDWEKSKWIGQSPALLDTFTLYYNLGKFMPVSAMMTPRPWEALNTLVQKGKLAIMVDGSWDYKYVWGPGAAYEIPNESAKLDFAVFPAKSYGEGINSYNFVSLSGGWAFVMNKNTKDPSLAWKFMKFLYTYQAEANVPTSHLTTRKDTANSSVYKKDEFLHEISLRTLPYTKIPMLSRLPKYIGEIQPLLARTLAKLVSGRLTPQEALNEYLEGLKSIVGSDKVETIK